LSIYGEGDAVYLQMVGIDGSPSLVELASGDDGEGGDDTDLTSNDAPGKFVSREGCPRVATNDRCE